MLISDLEHFNSLAIPTPDKFSGGLVLPLPVVLLTLPDLPTTPTNRQPAFTNETYYLNSVSPDGKQAASTYSSVVTARQTS